MSFSLSSGLLNGLLTATCLKNLFENGVGFELRVYAGESAPATADAAETGMLLNTYTDNGAGAALRFATAAADGVLTKDPAQQWAGTPFATGTPLYFRIVRKDDSGAASATAIRIQGMCGMGDGQMNFTTLALTQGAQHTINYMQVPFVDPWNAFSLALRNRMLDTGSLRDALGNFELRVYGGTSTPATPQAAAVGALLNTYTDNDTGAALRFADEATSGVLQKDSGQVWSGTPVASGAPRYFRIYQQGDGGAASDTAIRIQGPCQGARALLFESGQLTEGVTHVMLNMTVVPLAYANG